MSFKQFLLEDKASSIHFKNLFVYQFEEHAKISKKIKSDVRAAFERICEKYKEHEKETFDEDTHCKIEIDTKLARIGRYGGQKNVVYPSIKIGKDCDYQVIESCKIDTMKKVKSIMERYAERMNEKYESSVFKVQQEDCIAGEIRLVFRSGNYHKTIFMCAVEPSTKFQRLYFRDCLANS